MAALLLWLLKLLKLYSVLKEVMQFIAKNLFQNFIYPYLIYISIFQDYAAKASVIKNIYY